MSSPLPPPPDPSLAFDPRLPHDSKQGDIITSATITWLIGLVFVGLRFYTKVAVNRSQLGASEWCILAACMCAFAVTVCIIAEAEYGSGAHIYDLTAKTSNPIASAEAGWVSILFYGMALMFTKLAILILFINLFYHSWIRPASYALLAFVLLSNIWVFYVTFTACIPLQAFWDFTIQGAQCHPQVFFLSNQYLNIAGDFLLFFLPMPVLWNLNVRWAQKILLFTLFAMGFVVCILSLFRIVILTPVLANAGNDPTYNVAPVVFWTVVEMNLGIVVACGMTLKPLFNKFMPWLGSSARREPETGFTTARRRFLSTWGSSTARRQSHNNGAIRVESTFTAEYDGKMDEEMASLDLTARRMKQQDPFNFDTPHSATAQPVPTHSAKRSEVSISTGNQ